MLIQPIQGGNIVHAKQCSDMLDGMEQCQIFWVEKIQDGFRISEGCDNYFTAIMNAEQLKTLGEELIALSCKS